MKLPPLLAVLILAAVPCSAIIDDDEDWLGRFGGPAESVAERAKQAAPRAALESFLNDWLVRQDVEKALGSVDIALDDVLEERWKIKDAATLETWKRKWLTMWLYSDHGLVGSLGHGDPTEPGYAALAAKPSDVPARAAWKDIPRCELIPIPVQVGVHQGKTAYMVMVPMKTAPRDQVVLALVPVNGRWKVAFFESIAG